MLETVNLKRRLVKSAYLKRMRQLQEDLRKLQYAAKESGLAIVICLEGWDTAGKGRVISKLMEKLDPRLFRVFPGAPPSPLEQRYHFLWRYQVALPNYGEMAVFDHSWYGRVLVERCDGIIKRKQWSEAYHQINEFERWLADDGQVIAKFFLHISEKEQRKRFKECLADPLLQWKITKEYKRHHSRYDDWVQAIEEMLARTHTTHAPWTVVEANDLRWARVKVFEALVAAIKAGLARKKKLQAEAATPAPAAKPKIVKRAEAAHA